MRIISGPYSKLVLERVLNEMTKVDFTIVEVEMTDDQVRCPCKLRGLDYVLDLAPEGKPIVLVGSLQPGQRLYADNPRWHAALSYPNVAFRTWPTNNEQNLRHAVSKALEEAKKGMRPADPLALSLFQLNGNGSDSPFAGLNFPDVCVDIEAMTRTNVELDFNVLSLVRDESVRRPVTLWTDGDLRAMSNQMRGFGIGYKVVPKNLMRGARVEVIVSHLADTEFFAKYEIYCSDHRQV